MATLDFVLLIDDSDADNLYHEIVIKRAKIPCTIKSINSSLDALVYLKQVFSQEDNTGYPIPQLILLDINMPALNGFELLEKLRHLPDPHGRIKNIKICMLSGSLNPDDKAKAREEFADLISDFYVKPLTEQTFIDIKQRYFTD